MIQFGVILTGVCLLTSTNAQLVNQIRQFKKEFSRSFEAGRDAPLIKLLSPDKPEMPLRTPIPKVEDPSEDSDDVDEPKGYTMGYDILDSSENMHGRREVGDSTGNKYGSYSIRLADGRIRHVKYIADKNGFRAVVSSNEPGTNPGQDPADVNLMPYPPTEQTVLPPILIPTPDVMVQPPTAAISTPSSDKMPENVESDLLTRKDIDMFFRFKYNSLRRYESNYFGNPDFRYLTDPFMNVPPFMGTFNMPFF